MKRTDQHYDTLKAIIGIKEINTNPFWFTADCLDEEFTNDTLSETYEFPSVVYRNEDIIKLELN